MWKRKELKKQARQSIKNNYSRMVAVCFLTSMLTTAYVSSTALFNQYDFLPHAGTTAENTANAASNAAVAFRFAKHIESLFPSIRTILSADSVINGMVQTLINFYTSSQSTLFSVLRAVNGFLSDHLHWTLIFLLGGVLFSLLYRIFVANILLIGEKRFFLETRRYHDTRISKLFYLYKLRYLNNPVWVMFCRSLCQWLWDLTIVGGIIKHYEYILIPYILAENPSVSRRDAFFLSRQLMRGNKWRMFLLHFSFFGWKLLSALTLGLLDFLFVNPYMTASDSELYMELRKNYVRSRLARYELFNDGPLDRVPSEDELLISKALYDDSEGPYTKIAYFAPNQYPVFLYSIQPPKSAVRSPIHPDQKYSLLSCIFLFFAFSFTGWLLENFFILIRQGAVLTHNLLTGPWIPLYGVFGILLIVFIRKLTRKPIVAFLAMLFSSLVIEYLSNWLLESKLHIVLTDYSKYLMNLNGKTSLGGAVFLALLGCAFLYYFAPRVTKLFQRLPKTAQIILCTALCILFATDILHIAF